MSVRLSHIERGIREHFSLLLIGALFLGILVPPLSDFFEPAILPVLMAVIYLGFLKTDYRIFWDEIRNVRRSVGITVFCMFLLPSGMFLTAKVLLHFLHWNEEFAAGVLLLYACPVAALAPTLAMLMKGHFERTLSALVITSLLAPFSIPLLFFIWQGERLMLDYPAMSLFLLRLIVVPFLLALMTRRFFMPLRTALLPHTASLSVVLLMGVVFGAVAGLGGYMGQDPWNVLRGLILGFGTMVVAYGGGWLLHRRSATDSDRSTLAIVSTWTNIGLGIVFAKQFFPDSDVLLFVVLCEIPWNVCFVPAHAFIRSRPSA